MRKALFVVAVALGAAVLANGMRVSNGYITLPKDGGFELQLCAQAWKADGGVKALDTPCASCEGGWKGWTACEDALRKVNEFPPLKR